MISKAKNKNLSLAILISFLSFILLLATAKDIGMVWDEPAYMKASESYAKWFYIFIKDPPRALEQNVIDPYFLTNHEHPPLAKLWSGLFWYFLHPYFDSLTAFRIGPMISASILMGILYYLIAENFGKLAGLFSAAALLGMPRFFFHAHLAVLDVPVTVASFLVVFIFWKTIHRKGWYWGILLGIVWGAAVAVKLNAVFVFAILLLWILIFKRTWSMILRLLITGITAIATFFTSWPWLYHDTWNRVYEYVLYHVDHQRIGQWYLGQFYVPPPWHAVYVILWAVIPSILLLLFIIGIFQIRKRQSERSFVVLMILGVIISILPFSFGKTLLYDNDRLLMCVFPYIAALSGIGFSWVINKVTEILKEQQFVKLQKVISVSFGILFLIPQVYSLIKYYPHLLSYYSGNVGGLRGATKLGLETTYWCETYAETLEFLNTKTEKNDIIWAECDTIHAYQKFGVLRPDIYCEDAYSAKADWFLLQYRQSQYNKGGEENYLPLQTLKNEIPVYELRIDDVPVLQLFGALRN